MPDATARRNSRKPTAARAAILAAAAAALSAPLLVTTPLAHADTHCELGNLLVPQEVHRVGTYRDATCAMVADLLATSSGSDCVGAVTNYVVSRGYDPHVAKDIALHNC